MTAILPPVVDEPDMATRIRSSPEELLAACAAQYGDVFTVVVDDGHRITYVLDPHMFPALLSAPQVDFSPVSRQSKQRFGLAQLISSDERVRTLSHALTSGLRGRQLHTTLDAFDEELDHAVARYAASLGGPSRRTVQHVVQQTLIPATVYAMFGRGVFDEDFIDDFTTYSAATAARFAGSDPTLDPRGRVAEQALMVRLAGCLHRTDTPVLAGLSQRLLDAAAVAEEERLRLLLMQLWGALVDLVPAGVWMCTSAALEPDLVEGIRRARTAEDASHLRRSMVSETLRLYSRPNIYREVVEDFDTASSDGRVVRFTQGDWVGLFPRFLHHDPEVFDDPLRFHPRRFCPSPSGSDRPPTFCKDGMVLRHPTVVFGLGRGRCPGDAFTLEALARLLSAWTSSFDTRLPGPQPRARTDTVSSVPTPAGAIDVLVRPRTPRRLNGERGSGAVGRPRG